MLNQPNQLPVAYTGQGFQNVFQSDDSLLTNKEAASLLGIEADTLSVWRCTKRYAIPYLKIGRNVRYRRSDIERFKQERTVNMEGAGHA